MPAVRSVAKYIRISPRKVRIVMDLIRGKNVSDAFAILKFTPKRGAAILQKVLTSAVANAENNNDMDSSKLYISECFVDAGPTLKRIHPRSRGQAFSILKRTSHITIYVDERQDLTEVADKKFKKSRSKKSESKESESKD